MGRNKILNNTIWYFGGTVISALLGLISSPLLTRVISTEGYAQYGLLVTFTTLVSTFIYLGQDEAFMRFFDKRADSYITFLWRCIRIPLALCLIILILLVEPRHLILEWIFNADITIVASILIGLYIIAIVVQRFLMLTARMEERAANYSISNIVTKGMFIVVVVFFLFTFKEISFNRIIIALITGVLCAIVINISVVTKVHHTPNQNGENVTSRELFTFGIPFSISSTLFLAVPMIEKLIIRYLTDWETLAIYTAAAIFVTVMSMIKTTVNSIWIPYVYKNYSDETKFKKIFHDIGIALSWFCLCALAGTILTRRWLVLIFGSAYFDAYIIAPVIVCGACFDSLTSIYSIGINIRKKTIYHTIIPIIQLSISCLTLFVLLPNLGLRATGISYLASIAVSRIVQIIIAIHYYGTGTKNTKLIAMMFLYILSGLMATFVTSLQFDIVCAIILFGFGSFIAKNELFFVIQLILGDKVNLKIKH